MLCCHRVARHLRQLTTVTRLAPAHVQDLDLSDSDCLDVRPLRAATGLTRLALSGFALPPQHEVGSRI
jgi:hypothetical protein